MFTNLSAKCNIKSVLEISSESLNLVFLLLDWLPYQSLKKTTVYSTIFHSWKENRAIRAFQKALAQIENQTARPWV